MPIYMSYDGVDGDVTAEAHAGWIHLDSVQWGSSRAITTSGAVDKRQRSAVSMSEVLISKKRDHASGKLWREHLMGDPKTVILNWTVNSQGGETLFQAIKLSNVLMSSFASSGQGDDRPTELIALNFTEIECTFYDMEQKGTKTGKPFVQSYNLSKA